MLKSNEINCPLCGDKIQHKEIKCNDDNINITTHMWSCNSCPFVGLEYYSPNNTRDVEDYLCGSEDIIILKN